MPGKQAVFWHPGLYLQPQHFQIQDLHHAWLISRRAQNLQPYHVGLVSGTVSPSALSEGVIIAEKLCCVFPSGAWVEYPGNASVASRDIQTCWKDREKTLTLWLGLHRFESAHRNVSVNTTDNPAAATRWVTSGDENIVADLHDNGPDMSLLTLSYNVRIYTDTEKQASPENEYLPFLRLIEEKGQITEDPDFAPMALTVQGFLRKRVEAIFAELHAKARELSLYRRGTTTSRDDELTRLLALRSLNEALPQLNNSLQCTAIHPWQIYTQLAQLTGSLASLQEDFDWQGIAANHPGSPLLYDHHHQMACFIHLQKVLFHILNNLVTDTSITLRMKQDNQNIFCCGGMDELVQPPANAYLLFTSSTLNTGSPVPRGMDGIRLSSRSCMENLISHSLPGIPLELCTQPPHGVRIHHNSLYFRIMTDTPLWQSVLDSGHAALFWSGMPDDLQVQLILEMPS